MNGGFVSDGMVDLNSASIGHLDCSNGWFHGTKKETDGKIEDHMALNLPDLTAKRSVFLRGDFTAVGKVDLNGATIKGQLVCKDARFSTEADQAFNARRMRVAE